MARTPDRLPNVHARDAWIASLLPKNNIVKRRCFSRRGSGDRSIGEQRRRGTGLVPRAVRRRAAMAAAGPAVVLNRPPRRLKSASSKDDARLGSRVQLALAYPTGHRFLQLPRSVKRKQTGKVRHRRSCKRTRLIGSSREGSAEVADSLSHRGQ